MGFLAEIVHDARPRAATEWPVVAAAPRAPIEPEPAPEATPERIDAPRRTERASAEAAGPPAPEARDEPTPSPARPQLLVQEGASPPARQPRQRPVPDTPPDEGGPPAAETIPSVRVQEGEAKGGEMPARKVAGPSAATSLESGSPLPHVDGDVVPTSQKLASRTDQTGDVPEVEGVSVEGLRFGKQEAQSFSESTGSSKAMHRKLQGSVRSVRKLMKEDWRRRTDQATPPSPAAYRPETREPEAAPAPPAPEAPVPLSETRAERPAPPEPPAPREEAEAPAPEAPPRPRPVVVVEREPLPPERPAELRPPPRSQPQEPTVHIGVVEVIVTEPATKAATPRPSRHNPNAASRRYLRVF